MAILAIFQITRSPDPARSPDPVDPVKIAAYLMRYGFVIDQDRCIGCHACTVACKEEHQVPIGVFRTWVKYVEKGEFPHTSRHFGVMRCNHCDSARSEEHTSERQSRQYL